LSLFVDTSVWSLLLRRDRPPDVLQVAALIQALKSGERIYTTGLVLQELLQGFTGAKAHNQIVDRFAAFPLLAPNRDDHVAAAALRTFCRKKGVQVGTIDALLSQLCVRHELTMLSTDKDFECVARHCSLRIWSAG
jgi:predicted nucleic acid-binding protein